MHSVCFTMWQFGEWKGTRHPQKVFVHYTTRIPRVTSRIIQWMSWWVREEYVVLSRYDTTSESLASHHYYELVILRYYRTGCPCQIMYGNRWAGRQCLVKPEHQWADSFAESAHLVDSARCVHIQQQNEDLIKIGKIHPYRCYLCTDNFYFYFFFCFFSTCPPLAERRSQVR
jgi:hypothetical protein